jgi:hypothetical protein
LAFKIYISVGREIGTSNRPVKKYVAWSSEIPVLRKHGSTEAVGCIRGPNLRSNYICTLKIEAEGTSQTLVPFYRLNDVTTRKGILLIFTALKTKI